MPGPGGGSNTGGGGGQDAGFGGFTSYQALVDAVVSWTPKLTRIFLSRYQGKYRAWDSASALAAGAPQLPSSSTSSEQSILQQWSALTEKQRISILQFILSFRVGGRGCTRKYNRPYVECEKVVTYQGKSICTRYKTGQNKDICDQASAPAICKKVIATWQEVATCESFSDEATDQFFAWLSSKFSNDSYAKIAQKSLDDLYLNGVPRKRKDIQ
jgi:hypothetical protein